MIMKGNACCLRVYHMCVIGVFLVAIGYLLKWAESSPYMAISVIYCVPKLMDYIADAYAALKGTTPSLYEGLELKNKEPLSKALSNWLTASRAGDAINAVAVSHVEHRDAPPFVQFCYDYWKCPWTVYFIAHEKTFAHGLLQETPSVIHWFKDVFMPTFHIIKVAHTCTEWNGVCSSKAHVYGSSQTALLRFAKFITEVHGGDDDAQRIMTRVDRRTPADVMEDSLDEPLLS